MLKWLSFMRELFKKIFPEITKTSPQSSTDEPLPLEERYPIGTRGKREYEKRHKQREQSFRVKNNPPYTGSREEEYFVKIRKVASERPVNRKKRRLWLNKGQREIDRQKNQ